MNGFTSGAGGHLEFCQRFDQCWMPHVIESRQKINEYSKRWPAAFYHDEAKVLYGREYVSLDMSSMHEHTLCIPFARFGTSEIGLALFCVGYMPSLERQITFAFWSFAKNAPSAAHLSKSTLIVPKYCVGSFFSINAEVPALSNDFLCWSFFHSRSTSSSFIWSRGMLGV